MDTEIEDGRILLKNVLCPVAVMDIPVDDHHTGQMMPYLQVSGRDRDIIKKTEAHRTIGLGVMARRPHSAKRIRESSGHDSIGGRKRPFHGQQRRVIGSGRHHRIRIDAGETSVRPKALKLILVAGTIYMGDPVGQIRS